MTNNKNVFLLFPFHEESSEKLNSIIRKIIKYTDNIIVVDDASNPPYKKIESQVRILRNEKKNGKGAAIIRAIEDENLLEKADAILTADSDGQHSAEDILRAIDLWKEECRQDLIISGSRDFSNPSVPLRSKIGRFFSSSLVCIETGEKISDTQNGLRVYPISLFRTLKINSEGFGFETETLVKALRSGYKIKLFPIKTIYQPDRKSNFKLIRDSFQISILHTRLLFRKK